LYRLPHLNNAQAYNVEDKADSEAEKQRTMPQGSPWAKHDYNDRQRQPDPTVAQQLNYAQRSIRGRA
jgi:hypothetical protein